MEREKNQGECAHQEEKDLQHGLGIPPESSVELLNWTYRGLNINIHLIGQNLVRLKLANHCSLCMNKSWHLSFILSFVCLTEPVMGETLHWLTSVSWCARSSKEGSSCYQLSMPNNFHERSCRIIGFESLSVKSYPTIFVCSSYLYITTKSPSESHCNLPPYYMIAQQRPCLTL